MRRLKGLSLKLHFHSYALILISAIVPSTIIAQDDENSRYEISSSGIYLHIPGLVYGLRHNVNQGSVPFYSAKIFAGGDHGASAGQGFFYAALLEGKPGLSNSSERNLSLWKLPPGIVLGLRHSLNQTESGPTVLGRNVLADAPPGGLTTIAGGDLGAPSGHGFYWYESLGSNSTDWNLVDFLPRYTVIGLKHSVNQANKILYWKGNYYDPVNPYLPPPPGFRRMVGGDLGAPAGHGYYWYEKISGPVVKVVTYME